MAFPRCERCFKAGALVLACACGYAAVHPTDRCLDTGAARPVAVYCNLFNAEPAHGPHHDQPHGPTGGRLTVVANTSSSNTSSMVSDLSGSQLKWIIR
jgi:hypothetical protein